MNAVRAHPWVEPLSAREVQILRLISKGLANREISKELFLSVETIKWYNKQLYMKLGVKNRTQAVNRAVKLELLDLELDLHPKEKPFFTGNLSASLTSYVGRESEISDVKRLLRNNRLVVLTGAGGSGKTRLALKVGEELRTAYRDGVWLVELANLHDPSLVLGEVAKIFNISEGPNIDLEEALKRFLSKRELLLIIDNLEHLLECAPLIGVLLANAPHLSVLGTSRERLHIYGEQEYLVHPLDLPNTGKHRNSDGLKNIESIDLFIKRARAVQPTFSLDEEALRELARICVRLDGLPLAIELCAPMVKVFPLGRIAQQIENNLDGIPSGPRDLPARQQTLRGTIQWSYDLLNDKEKRLLERLAVFNGGGTLRAVEAICGVGISSNVNNILSMLVNKNLVLVKERRDGEIHFGLLETIRQFGRDQLLASGEIEQFSDRHASYYIELANHGASELRGPNQILWTRRLVVLYDNMRTALDWVIESGDTEVALQFVCNLNEFWLRHADLEDARRWLKRVVTLPNAQQFQRRYTEALTNLARVSWLQGRSKEAFTMAEQALSLARSQPDKKNLAEVLIEFGKMLVIQKEDFSRGQAYIEEGRDICREIHAEWELANALMNLAIAHSRKSEYNSARSLYSEAFNLFDKFGDINFKGIIKLHIGDLELMQNNLTRAARAYRESLMVAIEVENNLSIGGCLWRLARVTEAKKDYSNTVKLRTAGKMIFDNFGAWLDGDDLRLKEELGSALAMLGEERFQSAWEAGQNMAMEEAIELALGHSTDVG